jgi:hypothetical protein
MAWLLEGSIERLSMLERERLLTVEERMTLLVGHGSCVCVCLSLLEKVAERTRVTRQKGS